MPVVTARFQRGITVDYGRRRNAARTRRYADTGRAFGAGSRVAGATTLGPLAAGELVQAGALVRSEGGAGNRELSIPIDAARAVAGTLRSGERIDLIVTYGAGSSGTTEVVLRQALVIDVSRPGTGLASKAAMVLTLSVPTEADTVAVARALGTGELLVVRAPASGAADPSPVAAERNPASTP